MKTKEFGSLRLTKCGIVTTYEDVNHPGYLFEIEREGGFRNVWMHKKGLGIKKLVLALSDRLYTGEKDFLYLICANAGGYVEYYEEFFVDNEVLSDDY